ncbi:MAG TPA: M56 family metallopeptidase [Pirellulales bacterium]|nr:M56 family metallopeptidase [Pirellulales bacterium]
MNTLGTAVVWGVLQVTLFSLVGAAVYTLARRRGPAAGALAATASLAVAIVVSVLAFSPWPRWLTVAPGTGAHAADAAESKAVETSETSADVAADHADEAARTVKKTTKPATDANLAGEAWSAFWQALRQSPATAAPTAWRWPAIVGAAIGAGALAAVLRMLMGIVAVRRYRAATQPIDEPDLVELASQLARRMGCRKPIELRESRVLTTPATVGWRRPLVVLPDGWHQWTATERRVVLAHEIAHVGRGDYAAWLLAQFSLALHFYHPLVHWLARRLRLEQELAADAWGAEASVGRETYLMTLAQMALRQDDRVIAWAARPFFPNRGTFLRRIEMLRDPKQLRYAPSSWRRQTGLVAAVALAGLLIAGLRGPTGETLAVSEAAQPKVKAPPAAAESDLRFVPADSVMVFSIRPAAIFEQADMKPLLDRINQELGLQEQLGLPLEQIEEIQVAAAASQFPQGEHVGPMGPAELVVWRSRQPHDWDALARRSVREGTEAAFGKFKYIRGKNSGLGVPRVGYSSFKPDDHTLVLAAEPLLQRVMLAAGKPDAGKPDWLASWQQVASHATLMVDMEAFARAAGSEFKRTPEAALLATFSPLWEQSQRWYTGVDLGNGVKLQSTLECTTPEAAERVRATAEAALTMARNLLDSLGDKHSGAPVDDASPAPLGADLVSALLKQAKLTADGNAVRLQAEAQVDVADTGIAALVPAVMAAREAARRAKSTNNLRQIGMAFHEYADVFGHFPPAVVIGKDGKTPHSWRVAILPFIEGRAIWDQYKFAEPWDSENNKKLIGQMPSTLRDPNDDPTSTFSSYFMLTGETTIGGSKDGAKLADITDGTSNTILVVEAKRDIPWTKPEDIAYDPAKPLPKFGGRHPGGFLISFADGSVRMITERIDEMTMRALITKAGNEVVQLPQLEP